MNLSHPEAVFFFYLLKGDKAPTTIIGRKYYVVGFDLPQDGKDALVYFSRHYVNPLGIVTKNLDGSYP